MNERVKAILEHMLEDAQDVVTFTKDSGSYDAFANDVKTRKAVIMSLLNIGELANHLPKKFIDANPQLPWKSMIGMRNLAAHGYHTMHLDIVWDTTQTTIPELLAFLKSQLPSDTLDEDEKLNN